MTRSFFHSSISKSGPNTRCFSHFDFENGFVPQRPAIFRHLHSLPKMVQTRGVWNILTSKCASRFNGAHFFDILTSKKLRESCAFSVLTSKCALDHNCVRYSDISTSKSGPNIPIWCLSQFVFEMCFAPQTRALLRRLNRQKWLLV